MAGAFQPHLLRKPGRSHIESAGRLRRGRGRAPRHRHGAAPNVASVLQVLPLQEMGASVKFRTGSVLILSGLLAVGGCHRPDFLGGKPPQPTGQVVAVVEGREITVRDLNAELSGLNISDPKQRKLAQDRALRGIITRMILAKAAKDQGIDKTADFALALQRAEDAMLAQALGAKVVAEVPPPTKEEAERFVSDHPELFEQRKILTVEQLRFARPSDPTLLQQLTPLNTIPDIKAFLDREHVPYQEGPAQLDTAALGPVIAPKILQLPADEVFVIPSGDAVFVNQIRSVTTQPLTGDQATAVATAYLKREQAQEAVSRALGAIVQKGLASVAYNPAYTPAPVPTSATSATATNSAASGPASNAAQ